MDEKLSMALEDYLKEIWIIASEGKEVRVTDIALARGISKASVNKAMHQLKDRGLISQEHYGSIYLTEQGELLAEDIVDNYKICYRFMTKMLEIDEEEAKAQADVMEHIINKDSRKKIKKFIKKQKEKKK